MEMTMYTRIRDQHSKLFKDEVDKQEQMIISIV